MWGKILLLGFVLTGKVEFWKTADRVSQSSSRNSGVCTRIYVGLQRRYWEKRIARNRNWIFLLGNIVLNVCLNIYIYCSRPVYA